MFVYPKIEEKVTTNMVATTAIRLPMLGVFNNPNGNLVLLSVHFHKYILHYEIGVHVNIKVVMTVAQG